MSRKLSFHNLKSILIRNKNVKEDGTVQSENRIVLYNESRLTRQEIEQMAINGTLSSRNDIIILNDRQTAEQIADL